MAGEGQVGVRTGSANQAAGPIKKRKCAKVEQSHLAAVIEQVAESIVISDAAGVIRYVNPSFERVSGYLASEVVGRSAHCLHSADHDSAFYRNIWRTVAQGGVWSGRLTNRRKDGQSIVEEVTITPVRDAKRKVSHYVAVKRDVTREIELDKQLWHVQKMESISRLAAGVAHDFSDMLTVISGCVDLALRQPGATGLFRQELEHIREAALRAGSLTRQLLAFGQQQVLESQVLNLNSVIARMEIILRQLLKKRGKFVLDLTPDLWSVRADVTQLEQIILNLVIYVRDTMPSGVVTLRTRNITAHCDRHLECDKRSRECVRLEISDTGEGLDEKATTRLFEPFFTTHEMGRGCGLGLATVEGIVRQSGGVIHVHSQPGHGTTFLICLPHHSETDVPERTVVSNLAPLGSGGVILVVEDESTVRALSAAVLRDIGYRVLEASNGVEGLQVCEKHGRAIHLIICDMVMPRMSGAALLTQARKLLPEVRVLITSGYTGPQDWPQGPWRQVAFLPKPFTPAELVRKVQQVLNQQTPHS